MPTTLRVCVASLILLGLVSCSSDVTPAGEQPAEAAENAAESDFDSVKTPPAAGSVVADSNDAASSNESPDRSQQPASRPAATDTQDGAAEESAAEITIVPDTDEEPPAPRETLVGRWEFLICDFGVDILGMLVEVSEEGDGYSASIAADSPMMPGWKISSADLTDKSATIEFTSHDGNRVNFVGSLDEDGVVRGSVKFGEEGLQLVRWLPTELESLRNADPQVPSANAGVMEGFQPSPDNMFAEFREKVRELGDSALAYQLCRRMAAVYRGQRPPEDEFAGFPAQYIAASSLWGERVTNRTQLDIAYTMATCGYSATEAAEYLVLAEEHLADSPSESIQRRLQIARGLIDLHSDDEQTQQAGMEVLEAVRVENPFDTDVAVALAAYHDRSGNKEEALELFAELAALPTGAGDMEPVTRLWTDLGRDPADLEAFIDEVYKERVHEFAQSSSDAPRAEGNQQTILGELFTGAMCPPCVAADIATGGLELTYPKSDFIMLRYHQHVPGPDPLAVESGDQRARGYYRVQGTPSLYFNGQPIQVVSMYGGLENAAAGYSDLQQVVNGLLKQTSELSIDLQAEAADGEIEISAKVTGAEEIPETWRLRLCLADDEISYPASNGIRLHEMVVRTMPGGAEGVGAEEGELAYQGTVSLEEVRAEITEYISQIPSLPEPPVEMSRMHVVAFVQDDANRRILQAAAVPVAGLAGEAAASTEKSDAGESNNIRSDEDERPSVDAEESGADSEAPESQDQGASEQEAGSKNDSQ